MSSKTIFWVIGILAVLFWLYEANPGNIFQRGM